MKVIIQIPCLNEEATLPETLRQIPRVIPGVDAVEVLVIDDGSTDATSEIARRCGADHVVRRARQRGLAEAFVIGLDECLRRGADVIVNTDADNQYRGEDIPRLVAPILDGSADLAIGDRGVAHVPHFSAPKRLLQRLGSWIVRRLSGTGVRDATSGFRALSREAALRIVVLSSYTYTLETIIQAGWEGLAIANVPIATNPPARESRLLRSIPSYIGRSAVAALRTFARYDPLRVFTFIGLLFGMGALAIFARFLFFFVGGDGAGHVQSLLAGAVLSIVGFHFFMVGVLADLVRANRRLLQELLYRARRRDAGPP